MNTEPAPAKEVVILDAARKRFAHFGFSKVTMDEIAADVGMAKPSLYYYYATKERLFEAVIGQEQEHFASDIKALLKRPISAGQKLKEYVELRLRLFRDLVNLSHLSFDAWTEMKALPRDLFQRLEQQELTYLHAIIADGRSAGEFSPSHPHDSAQLLLHLLQGLRLRMLRPLAPRMFDEAAYTELLRESQMVIDWLIRGMRTDTHRDRKP